MANQNEIEFGTKYTTNSFVGKPAEAIPLFFPRSSVYASEEESQNLKVMESGRGLELHIPSGDNARIMSWEDEDNSLEGGSGTLRLAVAEVIDGEWPVFREPTIQEMVDFVRVALHEIPESPHTQILKAQVSARLNGLARVSEQQASQLRTLADSI